MKQKQGSSVFSNLKGLTTAAMLTAMSVVIGIFCKNFLNFGNGLFRVTFENFPIILSGILFGPVVGGLVGIASDLVSYLLSFQTYPPNLIVTLGAFSVGVLSGAVSRFLIRRKGYLQIVVSGSAAHLVGSMIIKTIGLYSYYGVLVLWRIPLYFIIAPLEILLLCRLLRSQTMGRLIGYSFQEKL
ncbi:MAG: folate family ECF transporter S component [Ruminococcaceae bacterium]|nr:folate family ECF transporter S component [Oscillospiraceae bacterium]